MPRLVHERSDVLPALAEVFREHGFDGASLAVIGARTGLGRGSLYHFFPGGKEEMAAAVLDEIQAWFVGQVFTPLCSAPEPQDALEQMLSAVERYFHSGRRVCLLGAFALVDARDRFAEQVRRYFADWLAAITSVLTRRDGDAGRARELAEETVGTIQGALVLARALDEPKAFSRALERVRQRLGLPAV